MNSKIFKNTSHIACLSFVLQVITSGPNANATNYTLPVNLNPFVSDSSNYDVLSLKTAFLREIDNEKVALEAKQVFSRYASRAGPEKAQVQKLEQGESYRIETRGFSTLVEFNPNDPNQMKINSKDFAFDSNLGALENTQKLEALLTKLNTQGRISWNEKLLQAIFPSAHALETWTIVAGIAAVVAVIWAISSTKKAKDSQARRTAVANAHRISDERTAELRSEFREKAKIHHERCLASVDADSQATTCGPSYVHND